MDGNKINNKNLIYFERSSSCFTELVHQPRIFNIEGEDNTQLIVDDLMDNVPYKFKVKSRTSQGFGPEREGIITIEAQDQSMFTRLPYLSVNR